MDSELLTSILVAIGFPTAIALGMWALWELKEKATPHVETMKENMIDTLERKKQEKTVEYQKQLLELLSAGYSEEQAKAMLKASMKIEQMERKKDNK